MSRLGRMVALVFIPLGVAVAFGAERPELIAFHIPAQPLIDALQAYSRQSGVQVMFETATVEGLSSQPVEGEFNGPTALRMLLQDSALKVHYTRATAVTVAPDSAPDPDLPPALPLAADMTLDTLHVSTPTEAVDRNRVGEYVEAVKSDIQKALQQAGRDRRSKYRLAVKLWVSSGSRRVERAELDGSTGDRDRDNDLAELLRGLTLSQLAPSRTPQPIRFMIAIHTP